MAFSDFRQVRRACHGVGIPHPDHDGSPPITRTTIPTCRAHYPGGPKWVRTSVASPPARAFPEQQSGRRPQVPFRGLLRLHACYGPLDRSAAQRRPLSRGFDLDGYPTRPLVSYQINRQFSGWNLPPLVLRAFGAHCCRKRAIFARRFHLDRLHISTLGPGRLRCGTGGATSGERWPSTW